MSEIKHTPGPWRIDAPAGSVIIGPDEIDVALTFAGSGFRELETDEANAEFIVRACNSHDELLAALQRVADWIFNIDGDCVADAQAWARAAIAKAKGGDA